MMRRTFLAASAAASVALAAPTKSQMGVAATCYLSFRRYRDTSEFLEHMHDLGAGGIQISLSNLEPAFGKSIRERCERYGMYFETMGALPGADTAPFEKAMVASKEAGALAMRVGCLSGRRYETFATLADWKQFVDRSWTSVEKAVRIAERLQFPLALENHKDWTAEEYLKILGKYAGPYMGACLDTGNNISLLDDPMELVEKIAPYVVSTHLKDMAVDEYPKGFLLSEMVMGTGMLDVVKIASIIRKARPKTKLTLEMITRDPLEVPCLTDKYWATFPDRNGLAMARTLSMVRANKPTKPLPRTTGLDKDAQLRVEEENVVASLNYAREKLDRL